MTTQEKVVEILDGISLEFEVLGKFAFMGKGTPASVSSSFVKVYESYQQARSLVAQEKGDVDLQLAAGEALCCPDGTQVGADNPQMDAAYEIARSTGMLPPPLLNLIPQFTMEINQFFIAAQGDY